MPDIIQLFNLILEKFIESDNKNIITKTLEAIKSWIHLKLEVLASEKLMDNLIKILKIEIYFIPVIEVTFKYYHQDLNVYIFKSRC